jgi:hypothetical protein
LHFDGVIYIGGEFSFAGGLSREKCAAIRISDGAVLDWNPVSDGTVYNLKEHGGKIYAFGSGTLWNSASVHGSSYTSHRVARFDPTGNGNFDTSFVNSRPSSSHFYDGDFDGGFVYVSNGDENLQPAPFLKRLRVSSGQIDPFWRPTEIWNPTRAIRVIGGDLFVGGPSQTFRTRGSILLVDPSGQVSVPSRGTENISEKISAIRRGNWTYAISQNSFDDSLTPQYFGAFNFSEGRVKYYTDKLLSSSTSGARVVEVVGNKIVIAGEEITRPTGSANQKEWGTFLDHGFSDGRKIVYHLIDLPLEGE